MIDDRNKRVKKLSEILNINLETVEKKVLKIQELMQKSQLVKIDSNSRVLLNKVY